MYGKNLYRFFIILIISATFLGLTFGCTSSKLRYNTTRSTYDPDKLRSFDEIQYKSAYKYDDTGKKYIKHYRQKRRREN
jgi:hypothetical protein